MNLSKILVKTSQTRLKNMPMKNAVLIYSHSKD